MPTLRRNVRGGQGFREHGDVGKVAVVVVEVEAVADDEAVGDGESAVVGFEVRLVAGRSCGAKRPCGRSAPRGRPCGGSGWRGYGRCRGCRRATARRVRRRPARMLSLMISAPADVVAPCSCWPGARPRAKAGGSVGSGRRARSGSPSRRRRSSGAFLDSRPRFGGRAAGRAPDLGFGKQDLHGRASRLGRGRRAAVPRDGDQRIKDPARPPSPRARRRSAGRWRRAVVLSRRCRLRMAQRLRREARAQSAPRPAASDQNASEAGSGT